MQDRNKTRAWDGKKMTTEFHLDSNGEVVARIGTFDQDMVPLIVMRCTGVKARYGILIYESDIVIFAEHGDWDRAEHGDINGDKPSPEVVKWNPHNLSLGPDGYPFGGNSEYWEIIGNIYEKET